MVMIRVLVRVRFRVSVRVRAIGYRRCGKIGSYQDSRNSEAWLVMNILFALALIHGSNTN